MLLLLLYIFIAMGLIGIGSLVVLFMTKHVMLEKIMLYFLAIFSILAARMAAGGAATNDIMTQVLAWAFALLSVIGVILFLAKPENKKIAKVVVAIGVLGTLAILFI